MQYESLSSLDSRPSNRFNDGGPSTGHRANANEEPEGPSSGISRALALVLRVGEILTFLVALLFFFFGVTGKAELLVRAPGYDEVLVVLGSVFIGPFMYSVYEIGRKFCTPNLKPSTELLLWTIGLRVLTVGCFVAQSSFLTLYMVNYLGDAYYGFIAPDILILAVIIFKINWTSLWTTAYVLLFAAKIGIFWSSLDLSETGVPDSQNSFLSKTNDLGENGWLSTLFLTIPIVHFPVLLSRLKTSGSIFEAHISNMAAVFAHILHFLDTLELYFLGVKRSSFNDDVQYLILMFSLMGCVTCNLYYISLFFQDDTAEKTLKRFQPANVGIFSEDRGVKNEEMLHYFLWMLFFIDLPFASMRTIAWIVHGTELSVFFAKNLMMMASVATLIIQHSRS